MSRSTVCIPLCRHILHNVNNPVTPFFDDSSLEILYSLDNPLNLTRLRSFIGPTHLGMLSVWVRAEQDKQCVKVSVADTGIGISKEGQSLLFSKFFREKRAGTRGIQGAGLGLSIEKNIVDFYHGRIEVQSELGKGSVFTVYLPFRPSKASEENAV